MNKKLIIIIISVLIGITIIPFLTYKISLLATTNINNDIYKDDISALINHKTIDINTISLNEEDYFNEGNISFKNIFLSYEKDIENSTDDTLWYKVTTTNGQETYLGIILNTTEYVDFPEIGTKLYYIDVTKFYEQKSINNNLDLMNYLITTTTNNNNILTSTYDIKCSYNIKTFYSDFFKNFKNVEIFTGDLTGYKFEHTNNSTEINIYKNDKHYGLNIINNSHFTEEEITDIINTIIIN